MNLGVTLKAAEKVFGPALPGPGADETTLSAVRYAEGKGKKFAGVAGIRDGASFYIHFPTPIDWSLLKSKKGTPDFVNDLKTSGPQGEQGREALVAEFMQKHEAVREKLRLKNAAAEKKARDAQRKQETVLLRQRLVSLVGEREGILTIGSESVTLPFKITVDAKGKVKISAAV